MYIGKLGISLEIGLVIVAAITAFIVAVAYFAVSRVFSYGDYESWDNIPTGAKRSLVISSVSSGLVMFYRFALMFSLARNFFLCLLISIGQLLLYNLVFVLWVNILYKHAENKEKRLIKKMARKNYSDDEIVSSVKYQILIDEDRINRNAIIAFTIFEWIATITIQLLMIIF